MDNRKIAFIICVNNNRLYREAEIYIRNLNVPEGFKIEIIPIFNAESMTSGYNSVMKRNNAKYKVYLHQDLFIMANCQVKCDTSCKKTSIADFQPRHFRGLELIRNRLCISSISFTRERSVFLG